MITPDIRIISVRSSQRRPISNFVTVHIAVKDDIDSKTVADENLVFLV